MGVLFVNLGGHGEAGLLFMNRLGNENAGIFRSEIQKQRAAVLHHGDELFIADPCGVEEDVVAQMADAVNDLAGIVDAAVIGAELDDSQADRAFCLCLFRVLFCNQAAQVVLIEAVIEDSADGAVGVARCFQVNRDSAGLNQCAVGNGFMVVSVIQDDIAGSEYGIQYDFIGSRGAVQYEVGLIRIVYAGSVLLCSQRRTFVNEQIAHGHIGIAEIGSEYVFTEEIVHCPAGRMLAEELAALMTGAVKLGIAVFHVFLEILEERRENRVFILGSSAFDLMLVESAVVRAQIHYTIHAVKSCAGLCRACIDQENRNAEILDLRALKYGSVLVRNNDGGYVGIVCISCIGDFPAFHRAECSQCFFCVGDFELTQDRTSCLMDNRYEFVRTRIY